MRMLTLSEDEIREVTQKISRKAQAETLANMGIPFRKRPDKTIVVLRAALEASLGYATTNKEPPPPRVRLPKARGLLVR